MADPTRLSLAERQLLADTLEAQNPIARAEIYRRLQPEDETWIRGALGDPVPPTTAQQIRSGVTTGVEGAARYARDNPVKTGAMIGGIAAPFVTGGASLPAQIAIAGLGGAGGAGLGALTGAAYGAPDVTPSMSTPGGVVQRMGTEGVGQALASALGHGVTAGVRGGANVLQRAGLPDQLAREFPTLAETLNQYRINPATAGGLARSKVLRKDATGALRDVVDAGIARGERGIVERDLAPYMRSSLQQAREEGMIENTGGRDIIRKKITDLMGQQPMGTFPLTPPPSPLQGATSTVVPGSPSGAGGGLVPGQPTLQPPGLAAPPRVASGPMPPVAPRLQPTTLAVAPKAAELVTPGELQAAGALPGSGDVPAIRPRSVVPESDPLWGHVTDMGPIPQPGRGAAPPTPQTGSNLPPGEGGSPSMWTPQTTYQEPEIPLRRMAPIRRQLFGRSGDVIKANALAQRPDRVASLADSDLATAVGQEADQRMPGWLAANAETQKFVGTTRAAREMQNAKITPSRVGAALGVATGLGGATGYETHDPLKTAAAFTLPFALMSPANTARTAIALYQAGRLPLAELLQVATPEVLQRFGLTEAPVVDTQGSHDPYAFLDQEAR